MATKYRNISPLGDLVVEGVLVKHGATVEAEGLSPTDFEAVLPKKKAATKADTAAPAADTNEEK